MDIITTSLVCLAMNIYFEARSEPVAGQIGVTEVVMNRVNDDRYPNTVCEVIKQGPTRPSWKDHTVSYPVKNRCQFSWYCDGKADKIRDQAAWTQALTVAQAVLDNPNKHIVKGATHYHAYYVKPGWASSKTPTAMIGDHLFYRWEKNK
jgi:spore germination cell wall hydrolase CwlJ-like protein|tara:strand:- start:2998 stop:3444 length:447 start_codon:yes stop_codon:yes gene_type:complete